VCRVSLSESGFGLFHNAFKRSWFANCELSQDFTINFDTGFGQAVNELTIGKAVLTHSSVDTLDPDGTELTLFQLTADIGVLAGFFDGLIGNTEGILTAAAVTLGCIDNFFMTGVFCNAS